MPLANDASALAAVAPRYMPISPSGCSAPWPELGAVKIGNFIGTPRITDDMSTDAGSTALPCDDVDPVERLAIAAQVPLAAVAVRHVVVRLERHVAIAERFEVECIDQLVDARDALMTDEAVGIDLSLQQRRRREHARQSWPTPAAGSD